jgi:hypothetical protein
MAVKVKRLVVDSLKPREIPKLDLTIALGRVEGVGRVTLSVTEVDSKTETIRLIITGQAINYESVRDVFSRFGAAVRSIDEIEVRSE